MRHIIFHAFGKAKVGAQAALRDLEKQGWETLPLAILGMPNLPPAWSTDTWKPIGGCQFTGFCPRVMGNSALRSCLLLKWRAVRPPPSELFDDDVPDNSLSCCPADRDESDLESADTPSSDNSANRAERLAKAVAQATAPTETHASQQRQQRQSSVNPQLLSPPLFVPWNRVAELRGVAAVHADKKACPHAELMTALDQPKCMFAEEKDLFLAANAELLSCIQGRVMPLEQIAPQVLQAIHQGQQAEFSWTDLLWTVAQRNEYWVDRNSPDLPSVFQINCGGLGGGALDSDIPPHFHCTCPPVGESQVYGPSLSPADIAHNNHYEVAAGSTTGVHELAILLQRTQDPCQKWESLGLGRAALLYQRTQQVLKAARLLPAHRRLPHKAFLSGLWWKLLSLQPLQLLACLPMLGCLRQVLQEPPAHFTINGFSAGSYTGAVIALAIRCLWPACEITAKLGAIAMPKGVLAALVATADQDRHHYYLVHAAEDYLCDWQPDPKDLARLQQSLYITHVTGSARWMGNCKHNYSHWLHCRLPQGQVSLVDLKLSHPDVTPKRHRLAAPMRLASWIRFETLMTSDDWEEGISLLVSNLHRPDDELLRLLRMCVLQGNKLPPWRKHRPYCLRTSGLGKIQPAPVRGGSLTWHGPFSRPFRFERFSSFLHFSFRSSRLQMELVHNRTCGRAPQCKSMVSRLRLRPLPLGCKACMSITLLFQFGRKQPSFARPTCSNTLSNSWSVAPHKQCTLAAKWAKPIVLFCRKEAGLSMYRPSSMLPLGDLPHLYAPAQLVCRSASSSSSTELRPAPTWRRNAISTVKHAFMSLLMRLLVPRDLSTIKSHRPTVLIKGCIPKGSYAYPTPGK